MKVYQVKATVNLQEGGVLYPGGSEVELTEGRAFGLRASLVQDDEGNPRAVKKAKDGPPADRAMRRDGTTRK